VRDAALFFGGPRSAILIALFFERIARACSLITASNCLTKGPDEPAGNGILSLASALTYRHSFHPFDGRSPERERALSWHRKDFIRTAAETRATSITSLFSQGVTFSGVGGGGRHAGEISPDEMDIASASAWDSRYKISILRGRRVAVQIAGCSVMEIPSRDTSAPFSRRRRRRRTPTVRPRFDLTSKRDTDRTVNISLCWHNSGPAADSARDWKGETIYVFISLSLSLSLSLWSDV